MMRMWFVGGEGCVTAAFDERRPQVAAMLAKSERVESGSDTEGERP